MFFGFFGVFFVIFWWSFFGFLEVFSYIKPVTKRHGTKLGGLGSLGFGLGVWVGLDCFGLVWFGLLA